jgi:hypothetical protein
MFIFVISAFFAITLIVGIQQLSVALSKYTKRDDKYFVAALHFVMITIASFQILKWLIP